MTTSLYDLGEEYAKVQELVEEGSELSDILDEIGANINEKVEKLALVVQDLMAKSESAKKEAKRLTDRSKRFEKQADDVKKYILDTLTTIGMKKVEGVMATVTVAKNNPRVEIYDEDALPEMVWNEETVRTINKTMIRDLIKDEGMTIEGARMVQDSSLRIK